MKILTNLKWSRIKMVLSRLRFRYSMQSGFGLVESLISVAVLGSAVFLLLGGLYTGSIGLGVQQEDIIAENLGKSQFEYTKSLAYQNPPTSYPQITGIPSDYSIITLATVIPGKDTDIQKISVTVYRNGDSVYTLEGYKVNR